MQNIQLDHSSHRAGAEKFPVCFLAHDIDGPYNIGSLFRIADALGVEKIYLTGKTVTPPNKKLKKTARSTEKYVSYSCEPDPFEVVKKLRNRGYAIVSLEITSASIDIKSFNIAGHEKICLIIGSENDGICQELLDASDATIHIPMFGVNSSMNLAGACAIATYEITTKYRLQNNLIRKTEAPGAPRNNNQNAQTTRPSHQESTNKFNHLPGAEVK
ncbi:MAG: TrmH family RNA methyltransferase [Pseudomonadota bacterium]